MAGMWHAPTKKPSQTDPPESHRKLLLADENVATSSAPSQLAGRAEGGVRRDRDRAKAEAQAKAAAEAALAEAENAEVHSSKMLVEVLTTVWQFFTGRSTNPLFSL